MPRFLPCSPDLIFKKNDRQDERLGNLTNNSLPANAIVAGYPDDDGIRLNGGRPGAHEGPDAIRKVFYKMTPPLDFQGELSIHDQGNLNIANTSLEERHKYALINTKKNLSHDLRVITLGGGHDYGYPDSMAFHETYQNQPHVIINFDAHLDVRPVENSQFHSGTPFFRLLSEKKSDHLNFFEVGIQKHCNSKTHYNWAAQHARGIYFAEKSQLDWLSLSQDLQNFKGAPLFVSFDIDCLRSSEAPGCSQSWPSGLKLAQVLDFFNFLEKTFTWRMLGIYEVSPPLEKDNLTAKAASLLMSQFLFKK